MAMVKLLISVRAALLGHRLRGIGNDQLGGESMTAAYSHGGYGWNQQLREAVTRLHNAFCPMDCPMEFRWRRRP